MVLYKKLWRSILDNKSRYIGSFLLIVLSSMLYMGFQITGPSVEDGVQQFREEHVEEDAYFMVHSRISTMEELEARFDVVLEERYSLDYSYQEATLRLFQETEKINLHSVVQGRGIENDDDIIIDPKFAEAHQLVIGDTIVIKDKEYYISGFYTTPDYLLLLKSDNDLLGNPRSFGIAVLSKAAFHEIDGYPFYSVKFNQSNQEAFKREINSQFLLTKWLYREDNGRMSMFDGDIVATNQVGKALPVPLLIMTCLLVSIVLWRLLKNELTLIGTMYALGYSKRKLTNHYLTYAILLSFAGGIVGTGCGFLLASPLLSNFAVQYNLPDIILKFSITDILISILLPFLFLVPTTWFVVRKALKLSPQELMRGAGEKKKISFLERKVKLQRFSFQTKFRLRELIRNIPRTLILVFGVTFASMLLLFAFVSKDTFDSFFGDNFGQAYLYEYTYTFNSLQQEPVEQAERILPIPVTTVQKGGTNQNFIVYGIEENARLLNLTNEAGQKLDFNYVIITKPLAKKLNMTSQDEIEVENRLTSEMMIMKVEEVADRYVGDFIYVPLEQLNSLTGYPRGSYIELWSMNKLNVAQVELLSSTSKNDIIEGYREMMEPIKYIFTIIAVIAATIGFIVLYIITSLIIEENKQNISLLKILGYQDKQVNSLLLNSNTPLVIIGYILSIPFILFLSGKLFDSVTEEMGVSIPIVINNMNLIIGFLLMLGTYEVTKWFSRKKVNRISMAESLKSRVE